MTNDAVKINDIKMTYTLPNDVYLNTNETSSYLKEIIKINRLPFDKGEYYFSDDIWDFSNYVTVNITRSKLRFIYYDISEHFKQICKSFVLVRLLENKIKTQTIHQGLTQVKRFIRFLEDQNIFYIEDVKVHHIESFLTKHSHKSIVTIRNIKFFIKDFFQFYKMNINNSISSKVINALKSNNYRLLKVHQKNNKTPLIPMDYFDSLIKYSLQIMDDSTVKLDFRAIASVIILLSQTGLRIGEILGIRVGSLKPYKIINGEIIYYLHYLTWKREKGNNVAVPAFTYVNDLTVKAYNNLLNLYSDKREKLDLDYLFMGGARMNSLKHFPIDSNSYTRIQKRFYLYLDQFIPTINLEKDIRPELSRCALKHTKGVQKLYSEAETLTYPRTHQFRVNVCTELFNAGIPLKYISKFMAHLSTEMEGYYVRPDNENAQENAEFTLKTLQDIVSGELNLLGASSGLMIKIKEFIKENNYNVEKDIDEICSKLSEKIPIRQKTGGLCIKSSMFRECSNDARTNKYYCAYGVCPNIFHFYYMVNLSYRQAKELEETININYKRGLLRQVQKELNMLKHIIKNKLKPEMDELKNVLDEKGTITVIQKYPDLIDIIENMEDIYKEMDKWRKMKIL